MKKAVPNKTKQVPTGVNNIENKTVKNPEEKKIVILNHFVRQMRKRPMKEEVKEILEVKMETFKMRIESAKLKKSPPITMNELEKALKSLKDGKSRDPNSWVREIFKEGVIGTDLKNSLLMMFNRMKQTIFLPECLRTADIVMIHKKGNKLDLKNWRGIFVASVLRTIFMKILHERIYHKVASDMTESQIGAQKKKSVRNHIFVLNSIISDVLSSVKKAPVDLTVMDYRQMFDAEEVFVSLNALYEAGVQDEIFALINESNRENVVSVKTPNGVTKCGVISEKIMQGDVLGPLVSSNMVDKHVGKMAMKTGNFYTYKNKVSIPPLAMVDDTLGISLCGIKTKQMSEFLNRRTNLMNLQFGCENVISYTLERNKMMTSAQHSP